MIVTGKAIKSTFTLLTVLMLTACAGQTPRSDFYVLSAAAKTVPGVAGACSSEAISVGPVSWPRYLDQPRIVTRAGTNRLETSEFNRWGGSLEDDFVRTTIENLSALLQSELVMNYRRSSRFSPVYRVEMDVLRFAVPGDRITVMRFLKSGKLSMAKPCQHCEKFLREAGIERITYSDWDGNYQTMRLV